MVVNSHISVLEPNQIPYSRKISKEKTFVNPVVLWLFVKVFSVKFGAWHSLVQHKWAICESFLRKNRIFHQSIRWTNSPPTLPFWLLCEWDSGLSSQQYWHSVRLWQIRTLVWSLQEWYWIVLCASFLPQKFPTIRYYAPSSPNCDASITICRWLLPKCLLLLSHCSSSITIITVTTKMLRWIQFKVTHSNLNE